jgi:copper transport protein
VYTVDWRAVSAVDGHATAGVYSFGIGVTPTAGTASAISQNPASSGFEMAARWILIMGLVILLGAAGGSVLRFGGSGKQDVVLATAGWTAAALGLLLLAEAQRHNAAASLPELLRSSVGDGLIWRGVGLGVAAFALLLAWSKARLRRRAMFGAGAAALGVMAAHVAAGHAAAGGWSRLEIVAQWAHFAAAGLWLGGLAALLIGVRGAPSPAKAVAVRRFSMVAAGGLVVVLVTGLFRSYDELSSWSDLTSTAYGEAVIAKLALVAGIAGFGAFNRLRSVPVADVDLGPLRRTSTGELMLAGGALVVAALLGTVAPPARGQAAAPRGLAASGTDSASTVRVELTTASPEPGANRFVVRVMEDDSGTPVPAKRVTLRFAPLDDPGVAASSLALAPGPGDTFVGTGANVAFEGRWSVTALIERGAGSTAVPLEIETESAPQFVSIERIPGRRPVYTVRVTDVGYIQFSPDPERPGPSKVYVIGYDVLQDERRVRQLVVTAQAGDGAATRRAVRRLSPSRFVAVVNLEEGRNTITAVARTPDGTRLRAAVDLEVSGD